MPARRRVSCRRGDRCRRSIVAPAYVKRGQPWDLDDADGEVARRRSRRCGSPAAIAADALVEVGRHVAPGVTTDELDRIGHEFMIAAGAYPSTLGYKGYPKSLCTSVNEVICHGIPDSRPLADGDVVKVDITAFIDGVHGDTCGDVLRRRRSRPRCATSASAPARRCCAAFGRSPRAVRSA